MDTIDTMDTMDTMDTIDTIDTMDTMDTIYNIDTIEYRGIVCINTFPKELIWCKTGTVLECNNCLHYATFKNILVGLCKNCAIYKYNGKYGNGFLTFPYSNELRDISTCFGGIHPYELLHIKGLEYPQKAINQKNAYTIYNLSLCNVKDLSLLLTDPYNIYGLYEIQNYYKCDIEVLQMIIDKIKIHKLSFNIWSREYYTKCIEIETFYRNTEDDTPLNINNSIINSINNNIEKYKCNYCHIYKYKKELKKCSYCSRNNRNNIHNHIRYCSIACQKRDWDEIHKFECKDDNNNLFYSAHTNEND